MLDKVVQIVKNIKELKQERQDELIEIFVTLLSNEGLINLKEAKKYLEQVRQKLSIHNPNEMTVKERKSHIRNYLKSVEDAKILQEVEELLANAMKKESGRGDLDKYIEPIEETTDLTKLAKEQNYKPGRGFEKYIGAFKDDISDEDLKNL